MKLNSIIFPAPSPSYTANQLLGEILYVPKSSFLEEHKRKMQQRLMEQAQKTNASYFWGSAKASDLTYA